MCLALGASRLWLRYAALQNLIPSFPCAPHPPPWRNPRKGRNQILPSGNHTRSEVGDLGWEEKGKEEIVGLDTEAHLKIALQNGNGTQQDGLAFKT